MRQDSATVAAKKFLEEHGYDVSGMKVSMHVDDIGGPSAGMMYTLGLIDKVTGEKLSGGKIIAGTGTMVVFSMSVGGLSTILRA